MRETRSSTFCYELTFAALKRKLACVLHDSRRRSTDGVVEGRAVDTAIYRRGPVGLRVIKDVEGLYAEEQGP
jgi:hypothetical protein